MRPAALLPLLASIALLGGAACDLVVEPGQETTLGNEGSVFGSSSDGTTPPKPAVLVRQQGTLKIGNASVFGGSVIAAPGALLEMAAAGVDWRREWWPRESSEVSSTPVPESGPPAVS